MTDKLENKENFTCHCGEEISFFENDQSKTERWEQCPLCKCKFMFSKDKEATRISKGDIKACLDDMEYDDERISESSHKGYMTEGIEAILEGDFKEAVQAFLRANKIKPDDLETEIRLCYAKSLRLKGIKDREELLRITEELESKIIDNEFLPDEMKNKLYSILELARAQAVNHVYFLHSNKDKAKEHLKKAGEMDPSINEKDGGLDLKGKNNPKKGCYIATACYDSPYALEIIQLSSFRDQFLAKNMAGRLFVKFYYWVSPTLAKTISQNSLLRRITLHTVVKPALFITQKYFQFYNKDES